MHPIFINSHTEWLLALNSTQPMLPSSKWFKLEYLDVYMRMGKGVVNGEYVEAVTIATVECCSPGQGHFKKFITQLEQFCRDNLPNHILLVENVVSAELQTMLAKHNYEATDKHYHNDKLMVCHMHKKP